MIIDSEYYHRNEKTGDIIKRQKVLVKCDECGKEWETLYQNIKRRKIEKNLCSSCRNKGPKVTKDPNGRNYRKNKISCLWCKNVFYSPSSSKRKYCSVKCYEKHSIYKKYNHLFKYFKDNINEVAYLFGLILGDGHLRKNTKETIRIFIAFHIKDKKIISVSKKIFKKLKIKFFVEPKYHRNCQSIGFVLPNKLLKNYGMLFWGNKHKAQPKIKANIYKNINFAAGLLNSDGYYQKNKNGNEVLGVNNTVESIIDSYKKCLYFNKVGYRYCVCKKKIDKRTGKIYKDSLIVTIGKKNNILKFRNLVSFYIKGNKKYAKKDCNRF